MLLGRSMSTFGALALVAFRMRFNFRSDEWLKDGYGFRTEWPRDPGESMQLAKATVPTLTEQAKS
jgi:hypothetical protein